MILLDLAEQDAKEYLHRHVATLQCCRDYGRADVRRGDPVITIVVTGEGDGGRSDCSGNSRENRHGCLLVGKRHTECDSTLCYSASTGTCEARSTWKLIL